MVTLNV